MANNWITKQLYKHEKPLSGKALINYKKSLVLNQHQKDIIIGTLLGDSSFGSKNGLASYCIKFEQKATQVDYVQHLYAVLKPFVGTEPKLRIFINSYHVNKPGQSYWFRTYSHESLKYYENLFYTIVDGKRTKRVPKNIHKLLTPRALAYWFMDDGSFRIYTPRNNNTTPTYNYKLNTQGFCLSDQNILVSALKRNFSVDVNIHKDKNYYLLSIHSRSSKGFKKLIQDYIRPSFLYKLGPFINL